MYVAACRQIVRFGPFEVEPETGELRKEGTRLKLQDQPFKVLCLLLEHPGELVKREDLKNALMPEASFGDFDHAINVAVAKLRVALCDSSDTPCYIETLPRRGYRFIGTLAEPEQEMAAVATESPTPVAIDPPAASVVADRKRHPRNSILIAAALLLAVCATLFMLNLGGWRDHLSGRALAPRINSLAVLPLENLSGDPGQDYFADGMTEELIGSLSRISSLRVISRTSVMRYKHTSKSLPEIARALNNVEAVVEGSVRREGERVRVTAQLIEARTERQIWAGTYDRDMHDILNLQSEVARAISSQVQAKLTPQDKARLTSDRRVVPEAHEAYLKGRYFAYRASAAKSIPWLEEATRIDPNYADAYASLAQQYALSLPAHECMPKAKAMALKAVELDESLTEAHVALATVALLYDWQWAESEKEFKRALELDPDSAVAHTEYAYYLIAVGRLDEAVKEAEQARKLDPLSLWINMNYGRALYFARRYDDAIAQFNKTLELDPNFAIGWMFRGIIKEQQGKYAEAIADILKGRELAGDKEVAEALGRNYPRVGYIGTLKAWAKIWEDGVRHGTVQPTSVGMIYARAGEKAKAFQFLEQGFREHTRSVVFLQAEPQIDNLRSDPRYEALIRKLGLPPAPSLAK